MVYFLGAAGCVSTLVHDGAMNPAEGMYYILIQRKISELYSSTYLHNIIKYYAFN